MSETKAQLRAMSAAEVREVLGDPAEIVELKVQDQLDVHSRAFIERSPFVALGTVGADGRADVSPRGDPAGFVEVLDDHTLAIPERPGNKLADSLTNVLEMGRVGLLFIVPGVEETLRVNGTAHVTDDADLLQGMVVKGKAPTLAIVVEVEEAFVHCAKAFRRSSLWDPQMHVERSELPSIGQMIRDQVKTPDLAAEEIEEFAQEDYRTRMY